MTAVGLISFFLSLKNQNERRKIMLWKLNIFGGFSEQYRYIDAQFLLGMPFIESFTMLKT
jgi:hypothetical protein